MTNLTVIYANAFKEKLKFIDGVVPEEPLDAICETRGRKIDPFDDIGEGEAAVLANVLGGWEGEAPGGVEVVGEDLLGSLDGFGLVLVGDIGEFREPCGGFGGSGEVMGKDGVERFGEGHVQRVFQKI